MNWRMYLALGRVSNLPTVWSNVLAGAVLAGALPRSGTLLLLCLSLSLFYTGGMYLNDAFDAKIDSRQRPERPIPSGAISARSVFTIGGGLIVAGLLLLVVSAVPGARTGTLIAGIGLAAVIVAYDAFHKGNPLSPVVMGTTRAMVYVTAGMAMTGRVSTSLTMGAGVLLAYLVGLTYVAKQETPGRVKNLWPLVFLGIPFVYGGPLVARSMIEVVLYVEFFAWVVYALSLLVRSPRRIPRAVVSLIAGISLLDGMLIALAGFPQVAWVAVAAFVATLGLQRLVSGT